MLKTLFNLFGWTGLERRSPRVQNNIVNRVHSELHPPLACEVYPVKSDDDGYFIRVQSAKLAP